MFMLLNTVNITQFISGNQVAKDHDDY